MSRPRTDLLVAVIAVAALALAVTACASDPAPAVCHLNDTRTCQCPGTAQFSSQSCDKDGQWAACACGQPGSPDAGGHPGNPDAAPGHVAHHGDICFSQDDCATGANLLCIIEHAGDQQGVCRLACTGFDTCLNNHDASSKFDTNCCDITNGTSVCANSQTVPAGTACH